MLWKLTVAALVLLGLGGVVYLGGWSASDVRDAWHTLRASTADVRPERPTDAPRYDFLQPWDGLVTITDRQRQAIGLGIQTVAPQTEPITLDLLGTTEYDVDNLSKIRPRFDTMVSAVHVHLGQTVQRGDPLIELYSVVLAEAKHDFELKRKDWEHARRMVEVRRPLVERGAISAQQWVETQLEAEKAELEYRVARDRLIVYGLTEQEVEAVEGEGSAEKAKMTLRSPADGIIIERDVVVGNYYDDDDTLLVIAPLDHLWVWGNIYESELNKVAEGQLWDIHFPFLRHTIEGKVDYISNRVDPNTRTLRIRTTIPNPDALLKSDMLVRGTLKIPPLPGQTFIPRVALIVRDGEDYVFVQRPDQPEAFERRLIQVAHEKSDHVVVAEGLEPGEAIVTNGSLLLDQMYEELRILHTGVPRPEEPARDEPFPGPTEEMPAPPVGA